MVVYFFVLNFEGYFFEIWGWVREKRVGGRDFLKDNEGYRRRLGKGD